MRSLRQPATTLPERNLGARSKIYESDLVPTGSECRFRIEASRAVLIAVRTNIRVLPKEYDNRCTRTHAPRWNFGSEIEFRETGVLLTAAPSASPLPRHSRHLSAGEEGSGRNRGAGKAEEEMTGGSRGGADHGGAAERGLFWKLPVARSRELGKLGPGMGLGAGCGVGFGLGLYGGAGLGVGFPGLQFGFGVGAGCGVGLGFGYGVGRGVAVDEHRRYSNVGHPMGALPSQ
ncbi:hypothetical protein Taro_008591 [Colocasia esculenta]|uniref:Uncharacterized protein n=1 Tax=Colocasia esculenta TaxID=4460 RepID=A0A843TYN3_COLES|nr:hypothetical protein [Colocasia esculenta]